MFSVDRERILLYLKLSFFQTVLFVSVYGFTNWLALQHHYHFQLWHHLELQIPFVPVMILAYVSLNLLMIVPAFILSIDELRALNIAMGWATVIAGLFFLLVPAPIGFVRANVVGDYSPFYQTLYSIDKTANTFPSLHITFSYLFVRILVYSMKRHSYFYWTWFSLIACSVLLTHQHHLIDIMGGMLLAEFCFRKFYLGKLYGKH
ncbi:MAG: phosphatase PAP2 family protein [Bacteriovorax sp.]